MPDEIIREAWQIKDAIAKEHNYDVRSLAAELMRRQEQRRPGKVRKATPLGPRSAPTRRSRP
jgi:hypothetical protein